MLPVRGIDHVAINVKDLDKAMDFYTNILGLKITEREPSKPGIEYFLDCGTSLIGLIQGQEGNNHFFQHEGLGANHVSFRVDAKHFDECEKKLRELNVPVLYSKKREKSWSLYFKDLDGNKLEITSWPKEDGVE